MTPAPIAIETRALSGPAGGVVRYIHGLLDGLARLQPALPLMAVCDHPRGQASIPNTPSIVVPPATPWLRWYWNAVALPRALQHVHPRLVHLTKPSGIRAHTGFPPIVTTIYDVIPLTHPETQTFTQRMYWKTALPAAARQAAVIITISEASKRAIHETLGVPESRITVTLPGIESRFAPTADMRPALRSRLGGGDAPYLLTVGTIEPRKNVDVLLRTFARIAADVPHTLVIAGRWGWKTEAVKEAARDPRLADRVRFLGRVENADLPALYSNTSAFVFLSQDEGFGFPPLEAMACGTPVLVSNRGSLPEVVGDHALLTNPADEDGTATALQRLLLDTALQTQLRSRGRAWAQQFTWERTARQTRAVYERILGISLSP